MGVIGAVAAGLGIWQTAEAIKTQKEATKAPVKVAKIQSEAALQAAREQTEAAERIERERIEAEKELVAERIAYEKLQLQREQLMAGQNQITTLANLLAAERTSPAVPVIIQTQPESTNIFDKINEAIDALFRGF